MWISVRARYDYEITDVNGLIEAAKQAQAATMLQEGAQARVSISHVGEAIYELMHAAGATFSALERAELQAGSGMVLIYADGHPLQPTDLLTNDASKIQSLLHAEPEDDAAYVFTEPRFESRQDAEEAISRLVDGEERPG